MSTENPLVPRDGHTEKFWEEYDKDGHTCERCGAEADEVNQFEVHHKNGNPHDGSMDNLVGICQSCHWDHHGIVPGKREGRWQERFFNEYESDQSPLKYP